MKFEILGKATFRVNFDIEADSEIEAEEKAKEEIKNIVPMKYLTQLNNLDVTAIELNELIEREVALRIHDVVGRSEQLCPNCYSRNVIAWGEKADKCQDCELTWDV
jgi:tRNA(Ile2) C34 agmatinyltransferase TiaS